MKEIANGYWILFHIIVLSTFLWSAFCAKRIHPSNLIMTFLVLALVALVSTYLLAMLGAITIGAMLGMFLALKVSISTVAAFLSASLISLTVTFLLSFILSRTTVKFVAKPTAA